MTKKLGTDDGDNLINSLSHKSNKPMRTCLYVLRHKCTEVVFLVVRDPPMNEL